MNSQRTVTTPLTLCLNPGVHFTYFTVHVYGFSDQAKAMALEKTLAGMLETVNPQGSHCFVTAVRRVVQPTACGQCQARTPLQSCKHKRK
jgi:hypothetical protein